LCRFNNQADALPLKPLYVTPRTDDEKLVETQDQGKIPARRYQIMTKPIAEVPSILGAPSKKVLGKPPTLPLEITPNYTLVDILLPAHQVFIR
jgi:hypothetical protein